MIEEYKNLCVLKAFNVGEALLEKCKSCAKVADISIECVTDALDSKFYVKNENASEVAYQTVVDKLTNLLGEKLYSDCDKTLEEVAVELAQEGGIKVAVAESITGGMICSQLVNVVGSSNVLREGFVTYSNESKVRRLHVKLATIENFGAISEETCKAMLSSLLENKETNFAIATTGCAGPGSDEFDTPVGVVYIGFGDKKRPIIKPYKFCGQRNEIRKCVANTAIFEMMKYCQNYNKRG